MKRLAIALALLPAFATAAPTPQDYAFALDVTTESGKPVQEFVLPDAVYASVRNPNLSDIGLFNGENLPLPIAWCAPAPLPPTPAELVLQVYPLQAAREAAAANSSHVDVTGSGRVQVTVEPGAAPAPAAPAVSASIIDARGAQSPLGALRVEWQLADEASELHVRVEASDDLDHWNLLAQTTLLQVTNGGQTLRHSRIVLPPAQYNYLRLERTDPGPQPQLTGVTAEVAQPAPEVPARWITAKALPEVVTRSYEFDSGRQAPMTQARIDLPAPNMALNLVLQSRPNDQTQWRQVWSGEVFLLADGSTERRNPQIRFDNDSDRYWRVVVPAGEQALGKDAPQLQLAYQPARVRFLAQGVGPWVLGYGSARAEPAPQKSCAGLVPGVTPAEFAQMLGQARTGDPRTAGGDAALSPPSKPFPLGQLLLWAVLVGGALLLIRMAMNLAARVPK